MQSEHKTQIYLSKAEHRALTKRARAEGRPMAAVVRDAVADYLRRPLGGAGWHEDPIGGLPGIAEGDRDASRQIDEVLYGSLP